jgi:hypothetical protein
MSVSQQTLHYSSVEDPQRSRLMVPVMGVVPRDLGDMIGADLLAIEAANLCVSTIGAAQEQIRTLSCPAALTQLPGTLPFGLWR